MAFVALFNMRVSISNSASMVWFVIPRLRIAAAGDIISMAIAMRIVVIYHNDSMVTPMKSAKEKIGVYSYPSIPRKVTVRMRAITISWGPIDRWVAMPAPVTVNDARIIIGNINYLSLNRLNDYLIVLMSDGHILHFRQTICVISLCSK